MKKIYTFILLMVMSVCSAFAQEPITKASELSNSKAYTISSSRATLQVLDEGTCLYASTGTATGLTDLDESNPNHRFALINGGKNFFLYSIGAGKFINNKGEYTDEVTSDVAINVVETESLFFPINLNWGSNYYLNTQEANQFATGYLIDEWSTLDNGNQFAIIEVGEFSDETAIQKAKTFDESIITDTITYVLKCDGEVVYTYTRVVKGFAPLTITYDAPGSRIGAACSDETPASKEITENTTETVVYNFTMDLSVLPFVPTTIGESGFAEGTKWYYLQPTNSDNFCYSSDSDSKVYYKNTNGVHPIDLHSMFAFTGNPLSGFRIYNYSKGAGLNVFSDNSSSYGNVTFSAGKTCEYFLEAGSNDGQYRFNITGNSDSYLHAYNYELEAFTWGSGWASTDSGSQFTIAEVADKEIAQALIGVLTADLSIASGTIFRNETAISQLQILFESTGDEVSLAVVEGMETGKITLVDAEGNVVATPKYEVDAEDKTLLNVTFDPEFNTPGTYSLIVEEGIVKDTKSGLPNAFIKANYTFMSAFEEKIVTARIWKTFDGYSSSSYPTWTTLPYETHDDGDYYTCKVKILNKDTFVLLDWMNAGGEQDTLKVQFDTSKSYYNCVDFNDIHEVDDYGSMWIRTSTILDPYGYYGAYFYPGYSDAIMDSEYGMCVLNCYSYKTYDYVYLFADWYMDDRYAMREYVDGKVHAYAFQDRNYTDDYQPAYKQLPYNENGTYDITVGIENDSTIVLFAYTGVEGEDLKINYDPETSQVIGFNDLPVDEYGSCQIASTVLDGKSGYWYAYTGEESYVEYDAASKSGCAIISAFNDCDNSYTYIYVSIGNYTPETSGIESVAAQSATSGKSAIYNIAGQRLSAPRKGFNIIDGKKVFNR